MKKVKWQKQILFDRSPKFFAYATYFSKFAWLSCFCHGIRDPEWVWMSFYWRRYTNLDLAGQYSVAYPLKVTQLRMNEIEADELIKNTKINKLVGSAAPVFRRVGPSAPSSLSEEMQNEIRQVCYEEFVKFKEQVVEEIFSKMNSAAIPEAEREKIIQRLEQKLNSL